MLDCDASAFSCGAVLQQIQNGVEQVIAYFSYSFDNSEGNYCVTRKELLAIIKALKQFHHYLYGRRFQIRSDHAALKWTLGFKHPEGQLARWLERLHEYDFEILYRPGRYHQNADGLSRRPCGFIGCRHCDRQESKEISRNCNADDHPTPDEISASTSDHTVTETIHLTEPLTNSNSLNCSNVTILTGTDQPTHAQYSDINIPTTQATDPDISPLIQWMQTRTRPDWQTVSPYSEVTKGYWSQWDSLFLRDDVLYRKFTSNDGLQIFEQIVLPVVLRKTVFEMCHSLPSSGHLGIDKTRSRIAQRFHWLGYTSDISSWCRQCDICAAKKGPKNKPQACMKIYNVGAPMERLALDLAGSFLKIRIRQSVLISGSRLF